MGIGQNKHLVISLFWLVLGLAMIWMVYDKYIIYEATGTVTSAKHRFTAKDGGAVAMLIGYLGMAISSLAFGVNAFLKYRKNG